MMSRHILRRNSPFTSSSRPSLRRFSEFSSSRSPNVVCNAPTASVISPAPIAIGKSLFANQIKAPRCFSTASGTAANSAPLDTVRMKSVTYLIDFNGFEIETVLTNRASIVDRWLNQVSLTLPAGSLIGFGREMKSANTVHFCVGNKCLIYHKRHMDVPPFSFEKFMDKFKFAGVGIEKGLDYFRDYGRDIKGVDVAELAKKKWPDRYDSLPGLHRLAKDLDIKNSEGAVRLSNWKSDELTTVQIEKACIDAFLSFEIAKKLA